MNITSFTCPVCGQPKPEAERHRGFALPQSLVAILQKRRSSWSPRQPVCAACLNQAKGDHLRQTLEAERGPLSPPESEVIDSLTGAALLAVDTNATLAQSLSRGERLAHWVSALIANWSFSATILLLLGGWIVVNLLFQPFDPFPVIIFAVISAVLASLAAIEGPIIMMSQRRQAKREQLQARNDYQINLKAELEVRYINEKIDHLLKRQEQLLELLTTSLEERQ
jgi:uncharacterized membrane protein